MRADGVYRLMLNVALFPGMGCSLAQDPKYVKVSSIENGSTTHYAIKVSHYLPTLDPCRPHRCVGWKQQGRRGVSRESQAFL